jgi:hypothetical protein
VCVCVCVCVCVRESGCECVAVCVCVCVCDVPLPLRISASASLDATLYLAKLSRTVLSIRCTCSPAVAGGVGWKEESTEENEEGEGASEENSTQQVGLCCDERVARVSVLIVRILPDCTLFFLCTACSHYYCLYTS